MKWVRRITRNGHSNTVSLPAQLLDHLRFHGGDHVVVELTDSLSINIRRVLPADLATARVSSMPLNEPTAVSK